MSPNSPILLVSLFCITFSSATNFIVISNPTSGLVLDASDGTVRIQNYTGSIHQTWKLEADQNLFYIVTIRTGDVLDVSNRNNLTGAGIIVTPKNPTNICQSWNINSDETISNACGNYVLDISQRNFTPGRQIISFPRNGGTNQKFVVQNWMDY